MENLKIVENIKKVKAIGIITSILLAICGILIVATPVRTSIFFTWIIFGTFFVNGIFRMIRYFMLPKETRNGWMLADGIISTLLGIIILIELIGAPLGVTLGLISFLGYMIGFYELFAGIIQLCSLNKVKQMGGSTGWTIFIGIVNILCGLFVIAHPIISYIALEWMIGIYLCVFAVTLFIECVCIKKKDK